MNITETIQPRSDQLNADDATASPLTITVTEVRKGSAEQPVELHNAEYPGRPYKPGKSMRRILVAAWGAEASEYVGRRMVLFNDQEVTFGRDKTGGLRISHLSHIDKPLTVALTVTRGRRKPFTVQPLNDAPATPPALPEPTAEEVAATEDLNELRDMYARSGDEMRAVITARVAEIKEGS